jgi:hypothetical protein
MNDIVVPVEEEIEKRMEPWKVKTLAIPELSATSAN